MTNRTKSEFTSSHCLVAAKTNFLTCCSQPVSRMLTTVLEWLTDFLTGAIMESRKAARSKAVASPPAPIISYKRDAWVLKCNLKAVNNSTQPQKPDWESLQVCLSLPCNYTESILLFPSTVRILSCHLICSNCFYLQQLFSGHLILRNGAISHNWPQIAFDRTIWGKLHNL